MTITFRIFLIIISCTTLLFVIRKIRKAQMLIEDAVFWVLASAVLVLLSIFPQLASKMAAFIGIYSEINFIFLSAIFVLMIKLFTLSVQVSKLKAELRSLIQEYSLREKQKE